MRSLLVCQHEPGERLEAWEPLLRQRGFRARYADFSARPGLRPTFVGAGGLVLLGGAMNVSDAGDRPHLAHEMLLVRQAVGLGLPVLGICLGAQLAAAALGGRVARAQESELGWHPWEPAAGAKGDPWFGTPPEAVFQWHEFRFAPPRGAVTLASTPACPHQAFRLGRRVLGTQFHFEADPRAIERWTADPAFPSERRAAVRLEAGRFLAASQRWGRRVLFDFLGA